MSIKKIGRMELARMACLGRDISLKLRDNNKNRRFNLGQKSIFIQQLHFPSQKLSSKVFLVAMTLFLGMDYLTYRHNLVLIGVIVVSSRCWYVEKKHTR